MVHRPCGIQRPLPPRSTARLTPTSEPLPVPCPFPGTSSPSSPRPGPSPPSCLHSKVLFLVMPSLPTTSTILLPHPDWIFHILFLVLHAQLQCISSHTMHVYTFTYCSCLSFCCRPRCQAHKSCHCQLCLAALAWNSAWHTVGTQ